MECSSPAERMPCTEYALILSLLPPELLQNACLLNAGLGRSRSHLVSIYVLILFLECLFNLANPELCRLASRPKIQNVQIVFAEVEMDETVD